MTGFKECASLESQAKKGGNVQKVSKDRYLAVFKKDEKLTQKEVAARAGVSITAAGKALHYLEATGKLIITRSPGMSLRYSLNRPGILTSPKGIPLSELLIEKPSNYQKLLTELSRSAITEVVNVPSPEELEELQKDIQYYIVDTLKYLDTLWETLLNASYEEVEATRNSAKKEK